MLARLGPAVLVVAVLALLALPSSPRAQAPTACATGSLTYATTGTEQCYRVPLGVSSVRVEAVGGRGGDSASVESIGGSAARVSADVRVTGGQILWVVVGGNGASGRPGSGAGGFNGGGSSMPFVIDPSPSGGGGGASDVRTTSCDPSCPGTVVSLDSRLLVAAGGGGAGYDASGGAGSTGGAGGTPNGADGLPNMPDNVKGGGATQTAGGSSSTDPGTKGSGGSTLFAGGGGGGLFGGGAGGFTEGPSGGGGGGSSFGPAGVAYAVDTSGTPRVTISAPPIATTNPATNVAATTATLNGSLNPNGQATSYRFEYGTSTSYGSRTSPVAAGGGTADVLAGASVYGLTAGTTYHFRVVATGAGGIALGQDRTFTTPTVTTPSPLLAAITGAASNVHATRGTVSGKVNAHGTPARYRFHLGRTRSYGRRTMLRSAGAGTGFRRFRATFRGLAPGTLYHYRIVAISAAGRALGRDRTFRTPARHRPPRFTG